MKKLLVLLLCACGQDTLINFTTEELSGDYTEVCMYRVVAPEFLDPGQTPDTCQNEEGGCWQDCSAIPVASGPGRVTFMTGFHCLLSGPYEAEVYRRCGEAPSEFIGTFSNTSDNWNWGGYDSGPEFSDVGVFVIETDHKPCVFGPSDPAPVMSVETSNGYLGSRSALMSYVSDYNNIAFNTYLIDATFDIYESGMYSLGACGVSGVGWTNPFTPEGFLYRTNIPGAKQAVYDLLQQFGTPVGAEMWNPENPGLHSGQRKKCFKEGDTLVECE